MLSHIGVLLGNNNMGGILGLYRDNRKENGNYYMDIHMTVRIYKASLQTQHDASTGRLRSLTTMLANGASVLTKEQKPLTAS